MIEFHLDSGSAPETAPAFAVSVIGIGGAGTNVIDKLALESLPGTEVISMNCDARALGGSTANRKVQLGKTLTLGLGCGGDPELGGEAAVSSAGEIRELLQGRNMVFLCVGLGGGTGSGAAPLVARMAREAGAFVVVFATLPFNFEGRRRSLQADIALHELKKYANALITFENDRMGELVVPKKGVQEAFEAADKIIGQSIRAVTSLVTQPGLINIGMDDLVTALRNTDSRCLFGFGQAKGASRAVDALATALRSPLLDRGQMAAHARNVLVHICGGSSLTLFEIETLMKELGKEVSDEAQILFGAAIDSRLEEHLTVTILTSLSKPLPEPEVSGSSPQEEPLPEAAAPEMPAAAPAVVSGAPAARMESPVLLETEAGVQAQAVIFQAIPTEIPNVAAVALETPAVPPVPAEAAPAVPGIAEVQVGTVDAPVATAISPGTAPASFPPAAPAVMSAAPAPALAPAPAPAAAAVPPAAHIPGLTEAPANAITIVAPAPAGQPTLPVAVAAAAPAAAAPVALPVSAAAPAAAQAPEAAPLVREAVRPTVLAEPQTAVPAPRAAVRPVALEPRPAPVAFEEDLFPEVAGHPVPEAAPEPLTVAGYAPETPAAAAAPASIPARPVVVQAPSPALPEAVPAAEWVISEAEANWEEEGRPVLEAPILAQASTYPGTDRGETDLEDNYPAGPDAEWEAAPEVEEAPESFSHHPAYDQEAAPPEPESVVGDSPLRELHHHNGHSAAVHPGTVTQEVEEEPTRVIRIERLPARPPVIARGNGNAHAAEAAPKRFVLTDIINRESANGAAASAPSPNSRAAHAGHNGHGASSAPEKQPAAVVRATSKAPAAQHFQPDMERVSAIRPITVGRLPSAPAPASVPVAAGNPVAYSPAPSPQGHHAAPVASAFAPVRPQPAPVLAPVASAVPQAPLRPTPTQQQTFDERLQPPANGERFKGAKPTVEGDEDLDVPTFLRRKR